MSPLVEITVYHLVMRQPPPPDRIRRDSPPGVRLAEVPTDEHARVAKEMYHKVGSAWHWQDRAHWDEAEWGAFLKERDAEVWLAEADGAPVGFFILGRAADDEVEIVYFGLVAAWIGRGAGGWLLSRAIERAWSVEPRCVLLETCSLDSPAALPNYQARGFEVRSEELMHREIPDGLGDMRQDYGRGSLDRDELDPDPFRQFSTWFEEAREAEEVEPNAMTLATVSADGQPSARVVLLKGVTEAGFIFFTDYRSRKSVELEATPRAALCFHWNTLQRQVRIAGRVTQLDRDAAAAYFRTRPRGSQLGAWASHQSAELASREQLEAEVARIEAEHPGEEIPLPPHWGGYVVAPQEIEFWQGRPDRLHDRFQYTHTESGWHCARLSP